MTSDFQRLIRIIFDSGPVAVGFERVATGARTAGRSVADLEKRLAAAQAASAKITTPKGLEQIQRLTSQAVTGIQATTTAMGGQLRAMQEEYAAEQRGGTAKAQLIRQRTELAALIRANTTATTAEGQTIRANLAAQERMAAKMAEITAGRKRDAKAAAEQEAAQRKLDAVMGKLRSQAAATARMTTATAAGPGALAEENRLIAIRNALLAAGVARINEQGRLTVTNLEGARAIEAQVRALDRQQRALAEVRNRLREIGSAGAAPTRQASDSTRAITASRAEAQALLAKVRAIKEEDAAERQGAQAKADLARRRAEQIALAERGVAAESAAGRAVLANLGITIRAREEIDKLIGARRRNAKAAADEAAAQERVNRSLSSIRARTFQATRSTTAERAGAAAVAAENRELAVRNALLDAGVAKINAQGRLVIVHQEGARAIRQATEALQREEKALEDVRRKTDALKGSTTGLAGSFGLLSSLVAGFSLRAMVVDFRDVALQSRRIETALYAVEGSSEGAKNALAFVDAEAYRLGQSLPVVAKAFTGINAASKDTALEGGGVRNVFSAVVETMTVLGRTAPETEGALLAISQMMSKGKVQAEELRGQLGERLPGAFQVAARAMGMTTAELSKALEQGQIYSEDFLPKFAAELRRTFGSGLENAIKGPQAAINRFESDLFKLRRTAGEGMLTGLLGGMDALQKGLDSPGTVEAARRLGENLGKGFRVAAGAALVVAAVVRNLPIVLVAYAAAAYAGSVATMTLASAFAAGDAALGRLGAAIAANPIGAIAIAAAAAAIAINSMAEASRASSQAFLDEIAIANQDAVAIARLRDEYDLLDAAKRKQSGIGAEAGAGEIVLKTDANHFLGQMAAVEATYKRREEAAKGDKRALEAAKIARDRDTAALQANTQAFIANSLAAIENQRARIDTALSAARDQLKSSSAELSAIPRDKHVGPAKWLFGEDAGVDPRFTERSAQLKKIAKESDETVRRLEMEAHSHEKLAERRKEALEKIQEAVDKTRVVEVKANGDTTRTAENARAEILKTIALKQLEARSAADLARAELGGAAAVREATIAAEGNRLVEEARLKAAKAKIPFEEAWADALRESVRATYAATQAADQNRASLTQQQAAQDSARESIARAADATAGNSVASRLLTASLQAEAEAERIGMAYRVDGTRYLTDQGEAFVKTAVAGELYKLGSEARAKATTDAYQADLRARQAAAALADELAGNSVATNKLTGDIAADNAARAAGEALSAREIATLRAKARFGADLERTLKSQTDLQKALNDARADAVREATQTTAGVLDYRQQADAARRYGGEIAGILQQFGLLNDASRRLALHEKARAMAGQNASDAQVSAIEAQLTGYDELVRAAQEVAAADAIAVERAQMVADTVAGIGEEIQSAIIDKIVTGKASWEDLAQSAARSLLTMIANVLRNFLQAEAAKQAAVARTIALQSASAAAGGGGSAAGGMGSSMGWMQTAASASGGGGAGGASSMWSGAGAAAGIFIAAALIVRNYSENAKRQYGSFTIGSDVPQRYGTGEGGPFNVDLSAVGDTKIRQMNERAQAFIDALKGITKSIGAEIQELGRITVSKSGRGKKTKWTVTTEDGTRTSFGNDEEAAQNFALIEALRQATLANASAMTQAALQGSPAKTADQLKSDLEFILDIQMRLKHEEARWMIERSTLYRQEIERVKELLGATDQLGEGMRAVTEGFARDVLDRRNAALGIQESPEAAAARRIAAFNEELAPIRRAMQEELARLLALSAGSPTNPNAGTSPGGGPGGGPIIPSQRDDEGAQEGKKPDWWELGGEASASLAALQETIGQLGNESLRMAANMALAAITTASSADEVRRRIEELQALLNSEAFRPISPEEAANAGRGQGRGQQRADARAAFRDRLAGMREAADPSGVSAIFGDLARSIRDLKQEGKEAGASQRELAEGERLLREEAQRSIQSRIDALTGKGPSDFQRQIREGQDFFRKLREEEQRAAGGKVLLPGNAHRGQEMDFLARMRGDLSASILEFAGLTDPMVAVRLQAAQMQADLGALAAAGGISAEEQARLTAAIIAGTEAAAARADLERQRTNNDLVGQLFGYLAEGHRFAAEELAMKKRKVELDFAVMKASLITAGIWAANAAIFDQAYADAMAAVIAGPVAQAQEAADTQSSAADTMRQAAEQFEAATRSLLDAQRALRGGDAALSYLNPREQVANMRAELDRTIAAARGGDIDARGRAGGEILEFLRRYQETFTSGGASQALARYYDQILSELIAQTRFNVGNVAYGGPFGAPTEQQTPVVYGGPSPSSGGGGDWSGVEVAVSRVEASSRRMETIMLSQGAAGLQVWREMLAKLERIRQLQEETTRDLRLTLGRAA